CGIADLDPDWARTGSIDAIYPLRDDAFGAEPARVREHRRAALCDVFIEQNASLDNADESRQCIFAVEKRAIPKILAVMLNQVEPIEDRCVRTPPPTQLVEPGQAGRSKHNGFTVDCETSCLDACSSVRDGGWPCGPVIGIAGVEPNCRTVPTHDQPVTVMLDFVNPVGARWRC